MAIVGSFWKEYYLYLSIMPLVQVYEVYPQRLIFQKNEDIYMIYHISVSNCVIFIRYIMRFFYTNVEDILLLYFTSKLLLCGVKNLIEKNKDVVGV